MWMQIHYIHMYSIHKIHIKNRPTLHHLSYSRYVLPGNFTDMAVVCMPLGKHLEFLREHLFNTDIW